MAASIFISYRRQDAIAHARAVFERLRADLRGVHEVFIDLEGLAYGEDFVDSLDAHLAGCRVMLVLLGPQWLEATDARGRRRIDNGADFVRLEVRTALARPGLRVLPLLIDGTEMPAEDDLPADLHPLLRRQAMNLRFASFDADMRHLAVQLTRMLASAKQPQPEPQPQPQQVHRPAWASAAGLDQFGRWAEFTVDGVVQRLRWIEPGEFLMGSPENEPQRQKVEIPRHPVLIGQGFWLADTACTQAMWLAVMGGQNPAHFTGDKTNPVERVSHEDAESFLMTLAGKLGHGAAPGLPTEAQWEYACRAGTTTAFCFGDTVTPEQVNYNANHPYGKAEKGLYRERTLPVKALPANAWGLYQMHGNVWEWCADGLRQYAQASAGQVLNDPTGPQEPGPEAPRTVRGGSWFSVAHYVRSAFRLTFRRRVAFDYLGFRLLLRS